MVLHSRGCGRVARRRILLEGVPVERHAPGTPVFFYPLAFWSAGLRAFPAGGFLHRVDGTREGQLAGVFHHPLEESGLLLIQPSMQFQMIECGVRVICVI